MSLRGTVTTLEGITLSLLLVGCSGGLSVVSPGALSIGSPSATPTPTPTTAPSSPIIGAPSFPSGGSGSCATGIFFVGVGQSAIATLSEPGYTGSFSVGVNKAPTVASVSISGSTLTVTAVGNGTDYFTVVDSAARQSGCNVGVTVTTGSAS